MVIDIGDVSVSIPVAISNWAHESEDNMTEFNGMIESMMYAVNKTMKERYSQGPYQKLYERQIKELEDNGLSHEDANKFLDSMVSTVEDSKAASPDDLKSELFMKALENLLKK